MSDTLPYLLSGAVGAILCFVLILIGWIPICPKCNNSIAVCPMPESIHDKIIKAFPNSLVFMNKYDFSSNDFENTYADEYYKFFSTNPEYNLYNISNSEKKFNSLLDSRIQLSNFIFKTLVNYMLTSQFNKADQMTDKELLNLILVKHLAEFTEHTLQMTDDIYKQLSDDAKQEFYTMRPNSVFTESE